MAHEQGESKYARKVKAGNQMYGPGCCGHRDPSHEVKRRREIIIAQRRRQPVWNSRRGNYA